MKKFRIKVTQIIDVVLDETKFTPEFYSQFKHSFYDYGTLEDHARHIAQLEARGFINSDNDFIEGYGKMVDAGISVKQDGSIEAECD